MPILQTTADPSTTPDPRLARTLWQWFALGLVAMLLVPAARGPVYLLGNMPFWLLLAPGLGLLLVYRHALVAAWRARLVRATPRRRQRFGAGQALRRSQRRLLFSKRVANRGQSTFSGVGNAGRGGLREKVV